MTPEQADRLEKIETTIDRIDTYIVGDPLHGIKGVIPRLSAVEKQNGKIIKRFWQISGGMTVLITLFGIFKGNLGL